MQKFYNKKLLTWLFLFAVFKLLIRQYCAHIITVKTVVNFLKQNTVLNC